MRSKNVSPTRRYRFFLLVLFLLFLAFLMISSNRGRPSGFPIVHSLLMEVFSPFQRAYFAGVRTIRDLARSYVFLLHVKDENERLKQRIVELERRQVELAEMAIANERLRRFLKFKKEIPKSTLPAELIGEDASNWFRTITVNKGSVDGVQKGMVVVAAAGLVGHVISTARDVSKVLLITDHNSSVPSICQASRARGIVQGKTAESCDLNYVSRQEAVHPGERVITSGLAGRYPKGLIVGTVTHIEKEPYGVFQKVNVTPAVDFRKLEEVFLILDTDEMPIQ